MLTLARYTATHVALLGTYPYRERLKALGLYPDLRFDSDERCWLLDLRTLPMLDQRDYPPTVVELAICLADALDKILPPTGATA